MIQACYFLNRIKISCFVSSVVAHRSLGFSNYHKNFSSAVPIHLKMGIPLPNLIRKLESLAPLKLAESWDNVGLLVEPDTKAVITKVLLTIDLTEEVVQEAVQVGAQMIISYHPNIFRPLKTITSSSWKERIVIQSIKHNIAIYSPHTTWDAMESGVNDWLASVFKSQNVKPLVPNAENPKIGMGRFVILDSPISMKRVIQDVKSHIGIPHIRLGLGKNKSLDSVISTVALCAGSGASLLNGVQADLYLTGEMLHHDVLDATQNGISVILCNHSDSERGFLKNLNSLLNCEELSIHVSNVDRDCLTTV